MGVEGEPIVEGRCGWANPQDGLYLAYHDEEWGVPEYDSRALWEKLVLDGFQAGLAWITILRKREAFRRAFAEFDPEKVARFGDADRARLMADAGIVRSGAKIDAAIAGARRYLDLQQAGDDFADFLWAFVEGAPIQNRWSAIGQIPAQTPLALEMSKALKAKGFKFCGPVIVYAFMQATGMVNDHLIGCFRHDAVAKMAQAYVTRSWPDALIESACPTPVCGLDEAGRGPWAGPVCAAAVILGPGMAIEGLDDSKKLTARRRGELEIEIKARSAAFGVGFASVAEIATLNILQATGLAMRRAMAALTVAPAFALVDGNYAFALPCPVKTVVGGDGLSVSIAAASILAKTARDRLMAEMDAVFPGYGFAAHKGYRAPVHARALLELGPCQIHRLGWAPVRLALMGKDPMLAFDKAFQGDLPFAEAS